MAEEALEAFFDELLGRTDGLSAVFVNDHEGVPMIQVVQPDTGVEDTDSNRLTATFSLAVEQVRPRSAPLRTAHAHAQPGV